MAKRANPEQAIQRAVVQHLRTRGAPGMWWCHVPNGGWRSPIEASIMKGLGVRAGVPDLLFCVKGTFFALELKAPGGKTTENQLRMQAEINAADGYATIAEGLDRAIACLEEWGILRGKSA
jgi:hypothetical protein